MEEPPGKPLSCEEKEKLKEKLAFLKREYSKTLARLQRAQRAERVKNFIKKPVKGQGCVLWPEVLSSQPNHADPQTTVPSCDTSQTSTHLNGETGDAEPEPEPSSPGRGPVAAPHTHGADGVQGRSACRGCGPGGEQMQSELPGIRRKQQKRTFISQGREPFLDSESLTLSGKRLKEQEELSRRNPGTAGTKTRADFSTPRPACPESPAPLTETKGRNGPAPPDAEPQSRAGAHVQGGGPFPGAPPPPSRPPSESSSGRRPEHQPPGRSRELTAHSLQNARPASPVNAGPHGRTGTVPTGNPAANEAVSASGQLPGSLDLEADGACSADELTSKLPANGEPNLKGQSRTERSSEPPGAGPGRRHGSGQDGEGARQAGSPGPGAGSPVSAASEAPSGAVLGGLLFPAECYVRTTRRMSASQRRVALEAVGQSPSHVGKKEVKNRNREATKTLNLSSEDTNQCERRLCGPSAGQASSGRPGERPLSLPGVGAAARPAKGGLPRKAVSQPAPRTRRGERKAAGAPASRRPELRSPASSAAGARRSAEEVASLTNQNEKAVARGKRRGEEGHGPGSSADGACSPAGGGASRAPARKKGPLSVQQLPSFLRAADRPRPVDFELPEEDFGPLKLEKLRARSGKPSGSRERTEWRLKDGGCTVLRGPTLRAASPGAEDAGEQLAGGAPPKTPPPGRRPGPRCLSPSVLLSTPLNPAAPDEGGLAAEVCTPTFPILGPTPLGMQAARPTCSSPPRPPGTAGGSTRGDGCASLAQSEGSLPASGKEGQPGGGCDSGPHAAPLPTDSSAVRENGLCGGRCLQSQGQPGAQPGAAGGPAGGGVHAGALQLVSKLQNPAGSCPVDVSAMWWEIAGVKEPCIVTACENAVSLWKPLDSGQWEEACSWPFTEVPVLQLVPVPDVCGLVCVALGDLEIREVRVLLCSPDGAGGQQVPLCSGNIQAVLGLTEARLASSGRTPRGQQVAVTTLAADGRSKEKRCLLPPEEAVLTFAEVQGTQGALLGATEMNHIVIWNLHTGQLLKKMHLGDPYQASVCHGAYSERGLLFVVLSHPCAGETAPSGSPVFQLVALNPRTALSVGLPLCRLPRGRAGRFLEGDVKGRLAAAVLTSGTVAVWDLLLGRCAAVLPPVSGQNWSFVRWSGTDPHLLVGQKDGRIFVYSVR